MRFVDDFDWLAALREEAPRQQTALTELRARIFAIIFSYLRKNQVAPGHLHPEEARHIAEDCTQEAIVTIRQKLDGFRGESKFTTWAYAIAIRTVLGELRRRRWRESAIDEGQLGESIPIWPSQALGPERSLQQQQTWEILTRLIDTALTPLQRRALTAHVFQDMPLDEVAEWLGSSRNTLYKLIHDARKRLKKALIAEGIAHRDLIAAFDDPPQNAHIPTGGKRNHNQVI